MSAPGGPATGDPGVEVDLATPPPAPAPLPPLPRPRRRTRRRRLLAAAVVLVLGAGWAAQRSGAQEPWPGAGTGSRTSSSTSTADAARLRRLLALDSTARRLSATDPRMLAAHQVEADCARTATTAPAPGAALRTCRAAFDGVQAQVWAEAYARALASASSGSPP